jgi:hypothetical protein
MPEPPEPIYDTATPEQIAARLEEVREQFRLGLMDTAGFNAALAAFQFTDEVGHLWAPGATSGQWYRWDGTGWTPAVPPARLNLPATPIMFNDLELPAATSAPPASTPDGPHAGMVCPNCGHRNVGKKFCTNCGTKLM